jgi:HK97 family phage prohead protease
MKKIIKLQDYLAHLDNDIKDAINLDLAQNDCKVEDMVIKRASTPDAMLEDDEEEYCSSGYFSTKELDFSNDFLPPEAWDLSIFKKNPLVFYQHRQSDLPIGKVIKISTDDKGLKGKIQYAVQENPSAAIIFKLVKGKYLRQHSVGFIATKSITKGQKGFDEVNKSMREAHPTYNGRASRIILKALLLECSIVNIGDNQMATIDSVKGLNEEEILICKRIGLDKIEPNESNEKPLVIKRIVKPIIKMALIKSIDELKQEAAIKKALELAKTGKIIRVNDL